MSPEENALRIEVRNLQQKNELMQKLVSTDGFFTYYFSILKDHRTNEAAFNAVNELYNDLFGSQKYSDFHSFKQIIRYHNRKNKK